MVDIDIVYEGNLKCRARHRPSGVEIRTAAPVDNQGDGSSFSPSDLVASALGACMATVMGIVARRHAIDLAGLAVHVAKEMSSDAPRRIARLPVTITFPSHVTAEQRQLLERAALACPVHHSIRPDIDAPVAFE